MKVVLIGSACSNLSMPEHREQVRQLLMLDHIEDLIIDAFPNATVEDMQDIEADLFIFDMETQPIRQEELVMRLEAPAVADDPYDPRLQKKLKKLENREQFRSKRDRRNHKR